MAKQEIIKLKIRSGWPQNIKSDCEYFNISYNQLAKESRISRHRIGVVARLQKQIGDRITFLVELTTLTNAFDRIISDRQREKPKPAWEW